MIAVLLVVFLSFKACSGFVSSMDGDNRSKWMALYRYFVINIPSGNLRYRWDIDSLLTGKDQKYQALDGVPSIKGLAPVH